MGRFARRISRSLIGALIITLCLGLAFFLKDIGTTRAQETPSAPAPAARDNAIVAHAAPIVTPMVTVTPTSAPSPQVISFAPESMTSPSPVEAPAPPKAGNPLADAKARLDSSDLLGARKILNDALFANSLSSTDAEAARKMIAEINQTVVFSPKRFANDEYGGTYSVQPGDLLQKIAVKYEVPWEALMRLNGMTDPKKLRAGQTIKVIHGPFHAVVSKSRYTLDIYLGPPGEKGGMYITTYPVGLGKDDSTPTGVWLVEPGKKLKNPTYYSPRGEGVIDADDPKNPLGERWIGLSGIDGHAVGKSSYGIHGTIDEASIGKMDSMGCVRLKNVDVEWVFDLLVEGKSQVIVKE
jgi:lipoprotein-anchoring transpeptidase ErfK/SrfK